MRATIQPNAVTGSFQDPSILNEKILTT